MSGLNALSATEIARLVAAGEITAEAVVRDCLARIEARDPVVKAWAVLDPDLALHQARERDAATEKGPLHGVPIGVKDIIDTADLATEMGSPIYRGHRPAADAACVAQVRAAGAIILGKTVTAEFAGATPGETTNPHDPTRTPGGSSSGSGAAVADLMVPAAFGTQTGGSVHRPAGYCGVVGYKPSFGTFNRGGVKPAAESLDTVGLLTRSLDDAELLTAVLVNRPLPHSRPLGAAPRIGLCRTYLWDTAEPETMVAVETAAATLARTGAPVREVILPPDFTGLTEARETINCYERARVMAHEWFHRRDLISPRLQKSIELGLDMPYETYLSAVRLAAHCRAQLDQVFDGLDVLLTPCVAGEAPKGLASTGDHRFQGLWTMVHVPTISLPTHKGPHGLPVSIQLVGQLYGDERLFAASRWIWDRLGPA